MFVGGPSDTIVTGPAAIAARRTSTASPDGNVHPAGSPSSGVQPRLAATDRTSWLHADGNGVPPGATGGPHATGTFACPTAASRSRAMPTPAAQPMTAPASTVTARISTSGSDER